MKSEFVLPRNLDPDYEKPINSHQVRCCGCNLPTPEVEAVPVPGYLLGMPEGCDPYVCRDCLRIAEQNLRTLPLPPSGGGYRN